MTENSRKKRYKGNWWNAKNTTIGNPNFILYGMHKKTEQFYIKKIEKKKCKVKIYLTNEDNSTSQSAAQMNPYGNNHTAYWFPAANMHTSTPINEASFPFMDQMMDNVYSENVIRNFSLQPPPSGNLTTTTIGNANSIFYGMDNYVNDV